jgi:hypothetical protein
LFCGGCLTAVFYFFQILIQFTDLLQ